MAVDAKGYSTRVAFSHREVNPRRKRLTQDGKKLIQNVKKLIQNVKKLIQNVKKGSPGKASPAPRLEVDSVVIV